MEDAAPVRQASALLNEARARRERARVLSAQGVLAAAELDAAEAAFQVAEGGYQDAIEEVLSRRATFAQRRAELDLAREQFSASVLTAPFDGAISRRVT